jgi:hypothetical protein
MRRAYGCLRAWLLSATRGARIKISIIIDTNGRGRDGNAPVYRVRQLPDPVARLEAGKNEKGDDDA